MKPPHLRPTHPTGLRRSRKPDWCNAIEPQLEQLVGFLMAKYHIQSRTNHDLCCEVIINMIKIEKEGGTIENHLSYSRLKARNLICKIQQDESQERVKKLLVQQEIHEELKLDTASSFENYDRICQLPEIT